jgi:hypothetical protein
MSYSFVKLGKKESKLISSVHPQLGDRNRADLGLHGGGNGKTLTIEQVHKKMWSQSRIELQRLERERFDSIRYRAATYDAENDHATSIEYFLQAIPKLKVLVKQALVAPLSPVDDLDTEEGIDMVDQKRSDHQSWLRILHQFLFLSGQTYHRLEMKEVLRLFSNYGLGIRSILSGGQHSTNRLDPCTSLKQDCRE